MNLYHIGVIIIYGLCLVSLLWIIGLLPYVVYPYYILPFVRYLTESHKLMPSEERISISDIASEGEWTVSKYSDMTLKRVYVSSTYGEYDMTIFVYESGHYIPSIMLHPHGNDTKFGMLRPYNRRIDIKITTIRTRDLSKAITHTYREVARHHNLGGPFPNKFTKQRIIQANAVGKDER